MEERKNLTFNELPQAVTQISDKIGHLEELILALGKPASTPKQDIRYTLPEAAAYCRMANPTFRCYLSKREVGGYKLGKAWLFTQGDLDAFLLKYRTQTTEQIALKSETILRRAR